MNLTLIALVLLVIIGVYFLTNQAEIKTDAQGGVKEQTPPLFGGVVAVTGRVVPFRRLAYAFRFG